MLKFSRCFDIIQTIEKWTLAYGILSIASITIANVFCRAVLNSSLTFAEELAQFSNSPSSLLYWSRLWVSATQRAKDATSACQPSTINSAPQHVRASWCSSLVSHHS